MADYLVRMENIYKHFGGVEALESADLIVNKTGALT